MNVIHRLKKNLSSAVLSRVCQSADSAVIPAEDFMSLRPIVNSIAYKRGKINIKK